MEEITIKDDFIKLGQALKLAGLAGSGVDAKFMIEDGIVSVNGEVELRRGRKVRPAFFMFGGENGLDTDATAMAPQPEEPWKIWNRGNIWGP